MNWKVSRALVLFLVYSSTGLAASYEEDFNSGPGGWTSVDLTTESIYWHQVTYDSMGVAWVGTEDPDFISPPGYGNDWHQYLTKLFDLGATPTLAFSIQYDTEPGFDFCTVEISTDGTSFTVLDLFDGYSDGFVTVNYDLTDYQLDPAFIRFTFTSDGSFSDEDGLWDTDGACRLDWVEVESRDDFVSDLDGWNSSAWPGTGGGFRLEQNPCGLDPDFVEPSCEEWPYEYTWVAYEENNEFPNTAEEQWSSGIEVSLAIESPVISIPAADNYTLEFDVYDNLPLEDGVFYSFQVAAPPVQDGGVYQSDNWQYFSTEGQGRHNCFDITELVDPSADSIQIQLVARTLNGLIVGLSGTHTAAPWFDNVCVAADGELCELPNDLPTQTSCIQDEDNDLIQDEDDLCPGTATGVTVDSDGCSDAQVDSDGDGVCNPGALSNGPSACTGSDAFPDDPSEWSDNDGDGTGDNADPDDDNDGQSDEDEVACGSDPLDAGSLSPDADSDDIPDCVDQDDDNDLVLDGDDVCPNTLIPDNAPTSTSGLGKNRWSLLGNTNGVFTQATPQAGSLYSFTTTDTRGCSCEQIFTVASLGKGHLIKGCSTSAMLEWINNT